MNRNEQTYYAEKPTLIFAARRNWTAVFFFTALSALHAAIAIPAYLSKPTQGIIAGVFCAGFAVFAVLAYLARRELLFFAGSRIVRRCIGLGGLQLGQAIPFKKVRAVRLSHQPDASPRSQIDLLCDSSEIPCPATAVPRQQALCLAMMMNVRLIHLNVAPVQEKNAMGNGRIFKDAQQ